MDFFNGKESETSDKKDLVLGDKADNLIEKEDPCWDGYDMVGMKTEDAEKVPNCVPEKSLEKENDFY